MTTFYKGRVVVNVEAEGKYPIKVWRECVEGEDNEFIRDYSPEQFREDFHLEPPETGTCKVMKAFHEGKRHEWEE